MWLKLEVAEGAVEKRSTNEAGKFSAGGEKPRLTVSKMAQFA